MDDASWEALLDFIDACPAFTAEGMFQAFVSEEVK